MATRFVTNPRRPAARKPSSKRRTAAQSNAAKAMKLFHSGQASSLAEAWQMVRESARRNPRSGEIETRSYFEALEPTRAKYDDLDQYDRWITHSAAAKILRKYEGKSDREVAKSLGLDPDDPDVIFYIEVLRTGQYWKDNPRRSTRYPKMARLQALRDLMFKGYSRRAAEVAGIKARPLKKEGIDWETRAPMSRIAYLDWVRREVEPLYRKAMKEYLRVGGRVSSPKIRGSEEYVLLVGEDEHREFGLGAPARRSNPEYHSPQASAPSVKRLAESLGISEKQADALRYQMKTGNLPVRGILHLVREYMGADDVEYIESREDTMYTRKGLSYVNTGDSYATTLVYDHKTHKFSVAPWAAIVERQPRRFDY